MIAELAREQQTAFTIVTIAKKLGYIEGVTVS